MNIFDIPNLANLADMSKINVPNFVLPETPQIDTSSFLPKYAETADRVLILGNGFDIGLGLDSSYKSFAQSNLWPFKNTALYPTGTLAAKLNENKELKKWFDLEELFYEYAKISNDHSDNVLGVSDICQFDKDCVKSLTQSLEKYLQKEQDSVQIDDECIPSRVLVNFLKGKGVTKIYTFNYTDIHALAEKQNITSDFECVHVHGSIKDHSCVLGVGDKRELNDDYFFLHKSAHPLFKSNKLIRDLINSEEIIIYGHSLGDNDFDYFKEFFQDSAQYENKYEGHERSITIFTADEESKLQIKKKIMQMSERNLISIYAHCNLRIICVKNKDEIEEYFNSTE